MNLVNSNILQKLIFFGCILHFNTVFIFAQEQIIYTKKFTEKLEEFGVTIAIPLENAWLHPTGLEQDLLGKYDLTIRSEPDDLEIRYIFKNVQDPKSLNNTPHAAFFLLCSTLATNNERAFIKMRDIHPDILSEYSNTDWGMEADFVPKQDIISYKKGRLIGLYKEGIGFFLTAIFYNDTVPDYLLFPIYVNEEN